MRNCSHIRPRSPDIPHMHASFLQRNAVPSATSDGNAPSERQNSVILGCQQLAYGQKTVLSGNRKGSIKQTNTSQVLVSETVPDRRVQPSRRAKMTRFGDNPVTSTVSIPPRRQPGCDTSTRNRREFKLNMTDPDLLIPIKQTGVTTRHSDLREPQPSSSDSQPASLQPVSETTTSESSVSLPSSPSGSSSTESTSTSGTDSSSSETSSESSTQPSSNASSPETSSSASTLRSTSPELLEMERSFNSLLAGTRDCQGHQWRGVKWTTWETSSSVSLYWSKLPVNHRTNQGLSQHFQLQTCHFPRIPKDVQVTRGLQSRCRQRMPMLSVRAVTQRQTDYRTFKKSLVDA